MTWILLWTIVFSNMNASTADTITSGSARFANKAACDIAKRDFTDEVKLLGGTFTSANVAMVCVLDGGTK